MPDRPIIPAQLRRRRLGMLHIVFFCLTAVAPLSVLGGSIVPTYALSGVTAYPLAIVLIAIPLALFAVGYAAMSRRVANAGAFYSYLAHGLGPRPAVAGAFVALVTYNSLQIAIYGVWGPVVADFARQAFGLDVPWWGYALVATAVVGMLGMLQIDLNATVLAVVLILEVVVVFLFDLGSFLHPAQGAALAAAWSPAALFVPGVGAVLALGVSAFTGFEQGAIYGEEARDPRVTVARATFATLTVAVLVFALSSWAMLVTVGQHDIQRSAADLGPELVFATLERHWGAGVATLANLLFLTGIFASLLSFHNGIARYAFALGREQVLPVWAGRVGRYSGGPVAGSWLQTGFAALLIIVFALAGADPLLQMYTWLAAISAVAILVLTAGTSVAIIAYFRKHPGLPVSTWARTVAPALATLGLLVLLVVVVGNFDALGIAPTSPLRWGLPGLVLLAIVGGVVRAGLMRRTRPQAYAAIGTLGMSGHVDDTGAPHRRRS